ncbi:MAG: hypothetical protein U0T11_07830 [Chitinophagaceae bacterium]
MLKQSFISALLLFFITISWAQKKPTGTIPLKEGEDGVYLFLSPQRFAPDNRSLKFSEVIITRTIGNKESYQEVGRLKAAASIAEFKKITGEDGLKPIMKFKKLKTEEEAWQYIQTHPTIDSYGILSSDIRFLEAMGICFADRGVAREPAGTLIQYKVQFKSSTNAANTSTVEGKITLTKKAMIEKPLVKEVKEADTVIIVRWEATQRGSEDALFGRIFRSTGNIGAFKEAGVTIANKDSAGNKTYYVWREIVKPATQYRYYVVPFTLTGLPGNGSDTASAISANFADLPQADKMIGVDTTHGIYLSWPRLNNSQLVAGIILERSKETNKGFQIVDTLTPDATSYLDERILPDVYYTYRIRLLSIRRTIMDVSAQATVMHQPKIAFIEVPEAVSATANEGYVQLRWRRPASGTVAGYHVYRSAADNRSWELVSNFVKDTVYRDSSKLSSRIQYKYVVTALNYSNAESGYSMPAFVKPNGNDVPDAPVGILGYSESGRNIITWKDQRVNDEYVVGYQVYRKTATAERGEEGTNTAAVLKRKGFQLLRNGILNDVMVIDTVAANTSYEYAVTAVDLNGGESSALTTVIVTAAAPTLRPPTDISARKTSKGVVITWNANLQEGVTQYVILRRLPEEKQMKPVGTVDATKTTFTDSQVQAGKLYFYSVQTVGKNRRSENGEEKGVRY